MGALILVRHADAENCVTTDFERKLTGKGRKQSAKVGSYLKSIDMVPGLIVHSPLVRARETAQIVAAKLGTENLLEDGTLACGMCPDEAKKSLQHEWAGHGSVMMVGHAPDFGYLLSDLVGASDEMPFKKCACAILDVMAFKTGGAILRAFVSPAYLP